MSKSWLWQEVPLNGDYTAKQLAIIYNSNLDFNVSFFKLFGINDFNVCNSIFTVTLKYIF